LQRIRKKFFLTLLLKDNHVTYQAFLFSFQARFDYWLSTNLPSRTHQLAVYADTRLKSMIERITQAKLYNPANDGKPFPELTAERASQRINQSGLGFRCLAGRFLYLNSINVTLPQTLDQKDENGVFACGLWPSLERIFGANSFDAANGEVRWAQWHSSGGAYADEHLGLIARVKLEHIGACQLLGKDSSKDSALAKPDAGFGYGTRKLHRTINGSLTDLRFAKFSGRVSSELPKDDQRRLAFEAADYLSNAFPVSIDASIKLSRDEFVIAISANSAFP
jgi:hypothetical protein